MAIRRRSTFASRVYKTGKRLIKKRYGTLRKPKIGRIIKDVQLLKSVINSEKKRTQLVASNGYSIGQCDGNNTNYSIFDLTPTPASGAGYNQRTGSSIKLHASHIDFMFRQMSGAVSPIHIKMLLVQVVGKTQVASSFMTRMYELNQFVTLSGVPTIVDYNSQLNPDYFKEYKILRTKRFTLPLDQITGQVQIKSFKMGIKYKNKHIRFDKDTITVTDGQLFLVVLADSGNISSSASTLANIPVSAAYSGCYMYYDCNHYYYDN